MVRHPASGLQVVKTEAGDRGENEEGQGVDAGRGQVESPVLAHPLLQAPVGHQQEAVEPARGRFMGANEVTEQSGVAQFGDLAANGQRFVEMVIAANRLQSGGFRGVRKFGEPGLPDRPPLWDAKAGQKG